MSTRQEDYLALEANKNSTKHGLGDVTPEDLKVVSGVQSAIIKDLLIPEIEREVNAGQTFANLRQIYNAVILASWYKQALKESLLGQVYIDQKKTKGVETDDKTVNEKIYNQYVESFKKGVYNFVKEDYNPDTQEVVNRKYFSGGEDLAQTSERTEVVKGEDIDAAELVKVAQNPAKVEVDLTSLSFSDAAFEGSAADGSAWIDSVLNQNKQFSQQYFEKDVDKEVMVDKKIQELFFVKHTQESFDLMIEKLRTLWDKMHLNQNRGAYVGLEFEDGVAYYMSEIQNEKILENNVGFLVKSKKIQNAKELIARFGTELAGHLGNATAFHVGNQEGGYFIDNRLLPGIIEGFVTRMEKEDIELDGTREHDKEVFLNIYFLLSLIDPNIYPDKTYDDFFKETGTSYPREATWEYAMDVFERVFTQQFDKEKYLNILKEFRFPQKGILRGASLPWSLTAVRGIEQFKLGFLIKPGEFYGFRHVDVKDSVIKARRYDFDKRDAQVNKLLDERIAQMEKELNSDAAMTAVTSADIDLALNEIRALSHEDFQKRDITDGKIKELFNEKHSQENFNLLLEKLKALWPELKLDQDYGEYIGLEFEDAMAYYLSIINVRSILEDNLNLLKNAPNSKEIMARFGAQLKAHLTTNVFHTKDDYFIDNRLLIIVIEGFVNQMEHKDFQSDGSPEHDREVFLNLYLLLSLIDPNIYPDRTLDYGGEGHHIPPEATWSYAMDVFERTFTKKFGKEGYLEILMSFRDLNWILPGTYLPWSFTTPSNLDERKEGRIGAGKFYSYRHPNVESKEALEATFAIIRTDKGGKLKQSNDLFFGLLNARITQAQREKGDKAMTGTDTKGGIDLNPAILSTEIKRNGRGVIIPAFKGVVPDLRGVEGFVPNIINVVPITNLPLLLGLDTKSNERPRTSENEKPVDVSYNLSALPVKEREELSFELAQN